MKNAVMTREEIDERILNRVPHSGCHQYDGIFFVAGLLAERRRKKLERLEDNIDSKFYHSLHITSKSFKSLWVLSTLFSKTKPKRMEKSIAPFKKKQVEKSHEVLERIQTVEV